MQKTGIKRIYDPASETDGYRILIDRLWPRGLTKKAASVDIWMKDIAPSTILRKWFDHDPAKWVQFQHDYFTELSKNHLVNELTAIIKRQKTVTLLYAAKDAQYNHAVVLQCFLQGMQKKDH